MTTSIFSPAVLSSTLAVFAAVYAASVIGFSRVSDQAI